MLLLHPCPVPFLTTFVAVPLQDHHYWLPLLRVFVFEGREPRENQDWEAFMGLDAVANIDGDYFFFGLTKTCLGSLLQ